MLHSILQSAYLVYSTGYIWDVGQGCNCQSWPSGDSFLGGLFMGLLLSLEGSISFQNLDLSQGYWYGSCLPWEQRIWVRTRQKPQFLGHAHASVHQTPHMIIFLIFYWWHSQHCSLWKDVTMTWIFANKNHGGYFEFNNGNHNPLFLFLFLFLFFLTSCLLSFFHYHHFHGKLLKWW